MPKKYASTALIPTERITSKIYMIRGKKVLLDKELAELYGVETKVLNQSVKRNIDRFPEDFMFRLSSEEAQNWASQTASSDPRSQIVTLKKGHNIKYLPYAFTEQGVAMLSSVLHSRTAVQANIKIIRTFVELRELVANNELIRQRIEELERKYKDHDHKLQAVFDAIKDLLSPPPTKNKRPIGFHADYES